MNGYAKASFVFLALTVMTSIAGGVMAMVDHANYENEMYVLERFSYMFGIAALVVGLFGSFGAEH